MRSRDGQLKDLKTNLLEGKGFVIHENKTGPWPANARKRTKS